MCYVGESELTIYNLPQGRNVPPSEVCSVFAYDITCKGIVWILTDDGVESSVCKFRLNGNNGDLVAVKPEGMPDTCNAKEAYLLAENFYSHKKKFDLDDHRQELAEFCELMKLLGKEDGFDSLLIDDCFNVVVSTGEDLGVEVHANGDPGTTSQTILYLRLGKRFKPQLGEGTVSKIARTDLHMIWNGFVFEHVGVDYRHDEPRNWELVGAINPVEIAKPDTVLL